MCFPIRAAARAHCLPDAAELLGARGQQEAQGPLLRPPQTWPELASGDRRDKEGYVSAPSPAGESQPSSFSSLPLAKWEQLQQNLISVVA